MFYGFVITERGNNILAHMTAGQQMVMTRVVMDKGTAESAEIARSMTEPIDAGPAGTSTLPVVKDNQVNMIVEYRSDLNGGLKEDFWIGGFAIYAQDPEDPEGEDAMIYYASLGNARQYVRAYVEGTAADVRRYPVSIKVTAGVKAVLIYPAEAWMTAEDIAEYVAGTLKPDLMDTLTQLIEAHDKDENAHPALLKAIGAAKAAADNAKQSLNVAISAHDEDSEAHPALLEAIGAAKAAADDAKQSLNVAISAHDEDQEAHPALLEAIGAAKAAADDAKQGLNDLKREVEAAAPIGSICWYTQETPPSGYLICDGSTVSRTDYANLFNVIGATFGAGDGETTFALPDLRAKFIRGAGTSEGYTGTFGLTQGATYTQGVGGRPGKALDPDKQVSVSSAVYTNTSGTDPGWNNYFRPYNIALTPVIKY